MERSEFEKFKSQVLALTPKQRQALQALVLGGDPVPDDTVVKAGDESTIRLLWSAVQDIFVQRLRSTRLPPLSVALDKMGGSLRSAATVCDRVIRDSAPELTRLQRVSCLALFARLAFDRLNTVGAPVSGKSMLQQLENTPALLDEAFPGYAESGLLGLVLRRQSAIA